MHEHVANLVDVNMWL